MGGTGKGVLTGSQIAAGDRLKKSRGARGGGLLGKAGWFLEVLCKPKHISEHEEESQPSDWPGWVSRMEEKSE